MFGRDEVRDKSPFVAMLLFPVTFIGIILVLGKYYQKLLHGRMYDIERFHVGRMGCGMRVELQFTFDRGFLAGLMFSNIHNGFVCF
jgi:hypothetical protein